MKPKTKKKINVNKSNWLNYNQPKKQKLIRSDTLNANMLKISML